MSNYENKIIDAVETIVQDSVSSAGYDKTIKATILKQIDEKEGSYLVKYQDSNLIVYSLDLDINYEPGTNVYVLIPGNDIAQIKSIVGVVEKEGIVSIKVITEDDIFNLIGKNAVSSLDTFELCSYDTDNEVILYDKNDEINIINFDEEDFLKNLHFSSYFTVSSEFKTNLPSEQRVRGNYGLGLIFRYLDENTQEYFTKTFILDINQMAGTPYNLSSFTKQQKFFEINSQEIVGIEQIYIFQEGFPNKASDKENDIFIKNIELYGASLLDENSVIDRNVLLLKTPDGNFFSEEDLPNTEKRIKAILKSEGKENTSEKIEYYWFKENSDIDAQNPKYNSYGGKGWECINEQMDLGSGNFNWITNNSEIVIKKDNIFTKEQKYKCVLLYENILLEQKVTIFNEDAEYEISIDSDIGTEFYYGVGRPTLTCLVNGIEQSGEGWSYSWVQIDNNYVYKKLPETTEENLEFNTALENYDELLTQLENEEVFENAVAEEKEEYLSTLAEYEYIQRVEGDHIFNLNTNEIINHTTYKCSVYYNSNLVGMAEITLYNYTTETEYSLEIINGDAIYKYNQEGFSPTDENLDKPILIKDLAFRIRDKKGEIVSNDLLTLNDIEWTIPQDNSLLIFSGDNTVRHAFSLSYTISKKYDKDKTNNTVYLKIRFKDNILLAQTHFSFLKDGADGTNGTDYFCKIVPNTTDNVQYPVLTNGILNYTPRATNKWFNLQLWKNGVKIFDNNVTGYSTENNQVQVKWSILKNKYKSNQWDTSSIEVNDSNFYYNSNWEEEAKSPTPANIVKCEVTYNHMTFYATMPIVVITKGANNYRIEWDENSGYKEVVYSASGINPEYLANSPFRINVYEMIDGIEENVSYLIGDHRVNILWDAVGYVYNENWQPGNNWQPVNFATGEPVTVRNEKTFIPSNYYDGECVTSVVIANITNKNDINIGKVIIPIHLMLNRYANTAINGWDGNSISINDSTGGYILSPQVGAGKKENGLFTGVLLGEAKEANSNISKIGLLGYNEGEQSLFIDAETGGAVFGKNNGGQIVIDPSQNKSYLYSHDYWKTYNEKGFPSSYGDSNIKGNGLLIDLTTPKIQYGDGTKFQVDQNGNLTCGTMITSKGLLTSYQYNFKSTEQWFAAAWEDWNIFGFRVEEDYSGSSMSLKIHPTGLVCNFIIPEDFYIEQAVCFLV